MAPFDPDRHHRRSTRLRGYDYSQAGAYFVTICAQNRVCLFGDVVSGEMQLTDGGWLIEALWQRLPEQYPRMEVDAFILMPNHFHGIAVLVEGNPALPALALDKDARAVHPSGTLPDSLSRIVQAFKSITTFEYGFGVKHYDWLAFPGKLWQRGYYEHIIRNERELDRIREYIDSNPARWAEDPENPCRQG